MKHDGMRVIRSLLQYIDAAAFDEQFLLFFLDLSGDVVESSGLEYLQGLEHLHFHVAPYVTADLVAVGFQLLK